MTDGARLARDLDRGLSLPSSWYTDPAVVERERERIFRRAWQYVGRTAEVARPGDYFTAVVAGVPVVVVRSGDGLGAFVNVCRHRRHEVASGAGSCKTLQCPYHAWTYGLDGRLRAAPRSDHEPGFDRADFPLLPVRLDSWGPFVFVNLDPEASPLADMLGDLPRIIAGSGLDLAELHFRERALWEADANWKVLIENFLECYHCPVQHPSFSAIVDVDEEAYSLRSYKWFSSQVAPVRSSALESRGRKAVYDAHGAVTQAQYHFVWPSFTISINPGQPNLSVDVWLPDGPERTRGFTERFFGGGVPEDYQDEMIAFNKQVSSEDDRLTSSVQHGLRAGLPAQGRFLTRSEHLVVHFQKLVLEAVGP